MIKMLQKRIADDTKKGIKSTPNKDSIPNSVLNKEESKVEILTDSKPKEEIKKKIIISKNKKPVKLLKKSKEEKIIDTDLELLDKSLKTTKKTTPKSKKNIWSKIKEKITIPDIISLENGRCECLLGQSITGENPSCQYNELEDILFCHKCNKGMNVIQVYAIINNLNNSNAIKEIVKQYKIEFGEYDKKYIKTESEIEELFQNFMEKCHKKLINNKEHYESIKNRRDFTDNTMETFKIGLFDDSIKDYMETTYSNELLKNAGFKSHSKKDKEKKGKLFWKWGKRFVYPYLNRNHNPYYFIYRLIDSEPDFNKNAKYIKQIKTKYIKEKPFGLNSIKKQKDLLIITEGITDAISLHQIHFQYLSPVTVKIKKTDIIKMISYCKDYDKVVVINDNEEFSKNNSGLEGSIHTLKVLIKHNINCFIGIIPNPKKLKKIDLNDYLRPQKDAIKKLDIIIEESVNGIEFLTNTINEKSSQDDLIEILEILPKNDFITQEDVLKELAKKRNTTLKSIRNTYKQYQDNQLLKEKKEQTRIQKQKKSEREDVKKDIFERITLDKQYDIVIKKEGVFKIIWKMSKDGDFYSIEIPILDGKLEILFKTYDNRLDNERFTFLLNGIQYNTYTIMNMIRKFEAKIYEGTHGKDIIKKVFNHYSNKIEARKPEYIIGFNNGWKLPHLEKEKNYSIISYTDIDRIVHKNAQKCVKIYTNKEKQEIVEKLKKFITTTQTTPVKLLKFITWSIASIFRIPIIDFFKIFPIFYNYGERNVGKGSLEEFYIVHFYNIHKKLLPSKTLDSPSRLEDYLASSTFPIVITEADGINIKRTLSIIKEHASDNTDFERKRPDQTLIFRKTKTAGLCLDSNIIIETFNDPALNSKCIMNEFTKKDIPKIDFEWKKLFRELKKEKLFSFIYDTTKEWNDKTLFDLFNQIIEETKEKLKNYEEIERINPRILLTFQICLFGLYVWKESFGFPLEQILAIGFNQLLESLILGRKIIPRDLVDQFYWFCLTAKKFEEDSQEEYTTKEGNSFFKTIRGNNPKYITCKLKEHKDGFHYAFTQDNLRDFNEYTKTRYNLKSLSNKLEDGLDEKEDVIYSRCYAFSKQKQDRVILINKDWLE